MKHITIILFLFITSPIYGQKECSCQENTFKNENTTACETIVLKDNSKLYWQFNCDRIWLTFEPNKRKKIVLDDIDVKYYRSAQRIGFQLIKEYKKSILFTSRCPLAGPCIYVLIDKQSGRQIKSFTQLIRNDFDSLPGGGKLYKFNFIVSGSKANDMLIVNFPDRNRLYKIALPKQLNLAAVPYLFNDAILDNNILTLYFTTKEKVESQFAFILNDKTYSR